MGLYLTNGNVKVQKIHTWLGQSNPESSELSDRSLPNLRAVYIPQIWNTTLARFSV